MLCTRVAVGRNRKSSCEVADGLSCRLSWMVELFAGYVFSLLLNFFLCWVKSALLIMHKWLKYAFLSHVAQFLIDQKIFLWPFIFLLHWSQLNFSSSLPYKQWLSGWTLLFGLLRSVPTVFISKDSHATSITYRGNNSSCTVINFSLTCLDNRE